MSFYDRMSHLYEWQATAAFTNAAFERVRAFFETEQLPEKAAVLDLACGTGQLLLRLAETKTAYRLTGLDQSEAMLALARQNDELGRVHWIQDDMRSFQLPEPVHAALCFSDSLNHLLSEEDLSRCLASVYANLTPGGYFLFDANTLDNYSGFWQGTDTDEGPNARLRINSRFDPATGRAMAEIAADEHTEAGLITTTAEIHEQYYSSEQVISILNQAGFRQIHHEDWHWAEGVESPPLKTWWRARRPI